MEEQVILNKIEEDAYKNGSETNYSRNLWASSKINYRRFKDAIDRGINKYNSN